ncbi:MAG: EutN/CcmL family microcompartment protein [Oscillospiraceae bacterium]|jgi:ethanolamine utilization protein EutN|nr:EutN/CcmL family microcompartment protein [Oscillospiraceae bacterium]MCI9391308.1 EutN/CcmL family microcompartment protein [Oscillospiraceae bacterium]
MIICRVVGHVWATKKEPGLEGLKLMLVKEEGRAPVHVAADVVGAGIGEQVLVVSGSTARKAFGREDVPMDMAIVGIVDSMEQVKH